MRITTRDAKRCDVAPKPCEHCGAMRPTMTVKAPVSMGGRPVGSELFVGWQPCGCEGAAAQRAAEAAERARAEAAEQRRRRDVRMARARIKPRYRCASHPDAARWADALLAGRSLYVTGGFGTGKTHLASAIALELIDRGKSPLILTGVDLMMELQSTYGSSSSETEVMDALARHDVLILDDLGKEQPTDWALSRLFAVVNRRNEEQAPMVVTTNYSRGELIDRLGRKGDVDTATALVSRLREMSQAIVLDGPDRRLSMSDGAHDEANDRTRAGSAARRALDGRAS